MSLSFFVVYVNESLAKDFCCFAQYQSLYQIT